MAFTAYGDAGLRPMSDIDVLVSPDNAEKAYHLLLKAGFQGPTSYVDNPLSDHHLPPLSYQGQTIELHRYLFPPFSKYYINERVIWEHTQDYHMGDTTVLGLKPAFHALYIATHLYYTYRRGGMRLSWFYDLKIVDELLVDCHPNEINQLVRDLKIELPTSFIGGMYSVLSGKQLTNWPLNTSYLPKNAILKKLPTVFKPDTQQNTNESYHLVLEQIRRAPGLKLKYKLIHSRLTNHGSLTGTALLKHALLTMNRLSNYYLTQLVTFWRR